MAAENTEITFHPVYLDQLKPEAHQWLASVNDAVENGAITPDIAKGIMLNKAVIWVPKQTDRQVIDALADHYQLPQTDTSILADLNHKRSIEAAFRYERLGVNPALPVKEYKTTDWNEVLNILPRGYRPRTVSFENFGDTAISTVVEQKRLVVLNKDLEEANRISAMTQQEWDEYRNGIRWSKVGIIHEINNAAISKTKKYQGLTKNGLLLSCSEEARQQILEFFGNLESTQQLDANTTLKPPPRPQHSLFYGQTPDYLSLDNVLVLKQQKS